VLSKSEQLQRAIDLLNSLVDYSHIPNLTYSTDKFDLQRVRDLLTLMQNPQSRYPIIHLAGTKGKGSTAVMIAAGLQEAGYRTGLFTSPYLFNFCEQIQVNREPISSDELIKQVENLVPFLKQVSGITTFEAVTATAFQYFLDNDVEIAVVETGMGGLTDATNIVDPLISVITSISLDHTGTLGQSLESIARHKAGILKTGRPAVIAKQGFPQAVKIIKSTAAELDVEIIQVDDAVEVTEISHSFERQSFLAKFNSIEQSQWNGQYELSLLGRHQLDNAATALVVLNELSSMGFSISPEQVQNGFRNVIWPCRFEIVSNDPLIVLDGAHNVDSTSRLIETFNEYLSGRKVILIFGVSVDKDIAGIMELLLPKVDRVIFAKSEHPRAADHAMLVELGQRNETPQESAQNVAAAIKRAIELADEKTVILITGSLFIAADARKHILKILDRTSS